MIHWTFSVRIDEGLILWATDKMRLKWHEKVDSEYLRCLDDEEYVCSPDFISESVRRGPAEVALQTPFRAGIL